jgi:hypothetical protein
VRFTRLAQRFLLFPQFFDGLFIENAAIRERDSLLSTRFSDRLVSSAASSFNHDLLRSMSALCQVPPTSGRGPSAVPLRPLQAMRDVQTARLLLRTLATDPAQFMGVLRERTRVIAADAKVQTASLAAFKKIILRKGSTRCFQGLQ